MGSKVNYTIIGFFVITLSITMVYLIFWLSYDLGSKHYKTYITYMNESVSGLSEEAPVKYNGVDVGLVKSMELNPRNPKQVRVKLQIENNIPVHQDTTATLEVQGITGVAFIGLRGGSPDAPLLQVSQGEKYPVILSRPSLLFRLDSTMRDLTEDMTGITDSIKSFLDRRNQIAFQNSLANLEKVSGVLAKNTEKLNTLIGNFNVTLQNVAKASKDFPQVVAQAKQSVQSLNTMAKNITIAGNQVSITMNHARTSIDALSTQLMPQVSSTLQSVETLSNNLEGISEELQQNPAVMIRGAQPNSPGPGEHLP